MLVFMFIFMSIKKMKRDLLLNKIALLLNEKAFDFQVEKYTSKLQNILLVDIPH